MIDIKNKYECCGCGACYNACPANAIIMKEDKYGFKYPEIDSTKCTKCDMCKKTCPQLVDKIKSSKILKSYAAYNKNDEIRMESSSGGLFTLLAEEILKDDGIVFGAQFDENFDVIHSYVDNVEDLYKFRGSKYVQSDLRESYKKVKELLQMNVKVLFTGTPCQVAALKKFLNKEYDKLYTQDIVCHGVPSPLVWRKYKAYRKDKDSGILEKINFRDKKESWKKYKVTFEYAGNNKYSASKDQDLYMNAFLKETCLRDSCYKCKFKSGIKNSDITLGDYWGIENVHPEINDDKGVSAVIINSLKGEELFERIKDKLLLIETEYDAIKKYNPALTKSVNVDPNREKFFENIEKESFDELVKKYTYTPSFCRKVVNKLKYECSKMIKK